MYKKENKMDQKCTKKHQKDRNRKRDEKGHKMDQNCAKKVNKLAKKWA